MNTLHREDSDRDGEQRELTSALRSCCWCKQKPDQGPQGCVVLGDSLSSILALTYNRSDRAYAVPAVC